MHVLVSGPTTAREFLQSLAAAVSQHIPDTECRYDLVRPSDYGRWHETDIWVAFAAPCDGRDMDLAPRLAAIVIPSLGYESIDVRAATERGIAVANGNVAENFESVAEAAFMFMLMTLYRVQEAQARLQTGVLRSGAPMARMLKGKTVGIIGYGNIARALELRLSGWGADLLVSTRKSIVVENSAHQCDLETLLARSDIVLPLVPLTDDTRGLLSRKRLLAMKSGAILINLSRGAVVDESALVDPVIATRMGGLAMDVFEVEPLPAHSPLRSLKSAVLTGHEIAHTRENLVSLFETALKNVLDAAAERPLETALNHVVPSLRNI